MQGLVGALSMVPATLDPVPVLPSLPIFASEVSRQPSAISFWPRTAKAGFQREIGANSISPMRDFRSLKVWEKAHQVTLAVYAATEQFPPTERSGLTAQLRRSAASDPYNFAEGCGRDGDRELARFLRIAAGSTSELEYQLLLARDLTFLDSRMHAG